MAASTTVEPRAARGVLLLVRVRSTTPAIVLPTLLFLACRAREAPGGRGEADGAPGRAVAAGEASSGHPGPASSPAALRAPPRGTVDVPAPVACRVRAVEALAGHVVRAGDRLALLYGVDGPPRIAFAAAEHVAAEHDLRRFDDTHPRRHLSAEDAIAREALAQEERECRRRMARARAIASRIADASAADLPDDVAREFYVIVRAPASGRLLTAPGLGDARQAGELLFTIERTPDPADAGDARGRAGDGR